MTIVQVDVDLSEFRPSEIADYIASRDDLWQLCEQAREHELERRQAGTLWEWNRRWDEAVRDGLIRDIVKSTL